MATEGENVQNRRVGGRLAYHCMALVACVRSVSCRAQVAEGLQLSGEQRQSMTGLWRGFNERMQRILAARHSIHATITSSMPDGIMGRDFARNFLKVPLQTLNCHHPLLP